jgi:protein-arginine kinase activator protein McsA
MACSIEMQFCERCGREVPSYFIRVVRDEEGEAQYVCEECVREAEGTPNAVEAEEMVPQVLMCD